MRTRTLPLAIIALLLASFACRLIIVWDRLPARMASHFNHAGQPDGWSSRSAFLTLLPIELGVLALLLTAPLWAAKAPMLLNLPHRDYWLAQERQATTLPRFAVWITWFAAGMAALLVGLNELIIRANLAETALPQPAHRILFWGFLLFVALWLYLFHRAFRPPRVR